MVSPCVASRVNGDSKAIHCFTKGSRGFSDDPQENYGPPTAFQLSKTKKKNNGYRKQHTTSLLTEDKAISSARLLGNVRYLSNVAADHSDKPKRSSLSTEEKNLLFHEDNTNVANRFAKNNLKNSKKNSISDISASLHFAAKTEQAGRRQMTSVLNAMVKSGPRPRRDSVVVSMYRTFNEQGPDAKSDPYRVHKWRQKSSRRKLVGMHKTPDEHPGKEGYLQPLRGPKRMREEDGNENIHKSNRKAQVPIPGVNLLPSLYVNERMESGSRDPLYKEEITLSFARNAAMEELERRFHDDRWKNKKFHRRKSKGVDAYGRSDNQVSLVEQGQIRRSEFLKKATASLKHPGSEVVSQSRESVAQTLEDIMKSSEILPPISNNVYSSQACSPTVIANVKDDSVLSMKEMSGAVRYKVVEDSFSEETVTIVSKPSEATSPSKGQISLVSRSSKTKLLTKSTNEKEKLLNELLPQPKLRGFERRFPVLPDFKKNINNTASSVDRSPIFSQLHYTLEKTNERQYQQFDRKKNVSQNNNVTPKMPPGKLQERRVSLPPLTNVNHRTTREKKAKQKVSRISEGETSMKSRTLSCDLQ